MTAERARAAVGWAMTSHPIAGPLREDTPYVELNLHTGDLLVDLGTADHSGCLQAR